MTVVFGGSAFVGILYFVGYDALMNLSPKEYNIDVYISQISKGKTEGFFFADLQKRIFRESLDNAEYRHLLIRKALLRRDAFEFFTAQYIPFLDGNETKLSSEFFLYEVSSEVISRKIPNEDEVFAILRSQVGDQDVEFARLRASKIISNSERFSKSDEVARFLLEARDV